MNPGYDRVPRLVIFILSHNQKKLSAQLYIDRDSVYSDLLDMCDEYCAALGEFRASLSKNIAPKMNTFIDDLNEIL